MTGSQAPRRGQGKGFGSLRTFQLVGNSVFVLLAASLCWLIGLAPLVAVWLLAGGDLAAYWALSLLALALSCPGLAALFAVFRDQPTLFSREARVRALALDNGLSLPDWIAQPYVPSDSGTRFFRPFFKAYRLLWRRALLVGGGFTLVIFSLIYNTQILVQLRWGNVVVPALLVLAALSLQALLVALILVTEYPKAKGLSVFKNGFFLAVRRLYVLPISALALVGYGWGLAYSPAWVALLASGITGYLLWASARWQADLLAKALIRESGDEGLIALTTAAARSARSEGPFSALSDFQQ